MTASSPGIRTPEESAQPVSPILKDFTCLSAVTSRLGYVTAYAILVFVNGAPFPLEDSTTIARRLPSLISRTMSK